MAAVRYKIAVDAYPRFKHFHDRLASIISRLENLEAVGNFASCISMGQEKFANIVNVTKQLVKQEICLTIVPNDVKLPLTDDFVSRLRVGDGEATMSWETIKEEGVVDDMRSLSKFHPHFVVFLSTSSMAAMQERNKHLLNKANDQRDNIVVHDMTSSTTYSYLELADPKLTREAKESSKILKTVGLKIQHMLEDKAVEILENMVVFNENFAPRDGQDMDLTISLECSSQVRENFDNQHIISDLDPEKNGIILRRKEAKGKEASAQKLVTPVLTHSQVETVLRRCRTKLVENLVPQPVLDELFSKQIIPTFALRDSIMSTPLTSAQSRKIIDFIENKGWQAYEAFRECLQLSKQEELLSFLIQEEKSLNIPGDQSSSVQGKGLSSTDEDVMETDGEPLEPQQKQQLTEEQLEEIFYEKYIEFLCKKTKCITCDHLAQKFGISGSLVNEFLNEGYFSFEENYRKAVETMRKLKWSAVSKCREGSMVQYDYIMRQTSFLRAAEEYVQEKVKMLGEFGKMNFEIYGLLRQARVQVFMKMPHYPAIPREMSDDLLRLGEVVGCGTIYGKLTIHLVKGQPLINHELKENIRKILADYRYPQSFRLQNLLETQSHARGMESTDSISAGDKLRARLTDEEYERLQEEEKKKKKQLEEKQNKKMEIQNEPEVESREKYGTLGCFIGLREKTASDSGEDMKVEGAVGGENNPGRGAHLYGITCAHCVTGCHPDIGAKQVTDDQYRDFGNTEYVLFDREKIDIAAIRVTKGRSKCSSDILKSRWDFYTGEAGDLHLEADIVCKHGAVTKTTEGIIISNDYRSDIRDNLRDDLMAEANADTDKTRNFDPEFNILIDIKAAEGLSSQEQVFPSKNPMVPKQQSSGDQAAGANVEEKMDTDRCPERPTFTHPLTPTAPVKAGTDVTMECIVNGFPKPKVTWYRGQQALSSSDSVKIETVGDHHMLTIRRTSQLDAGSYRAVALNSAGQAESMCDLQQETDRCSKRPTFTRPLAPAATVKAGTDVTMECIVNGYPMPKVTWYRGQQELSSSDSVKIETVGNHHMLTIRGTSQLNAGSYRAVASNSAGQAESMCDLQVKMPVFSEAGDSGAVVYYTHLKIDGDEVRLASLLGGNMVIYDAIHGRLEFSYSSHLKKSLDALCAQDNLEIVMPWNVA